MPDSSNPSPSSVTGPAFDRANRAEQSLLSYEQAHANRLQIDWDDHEIASPWFLGRRVLDDLPLAEIAQFVFPRILEHPRAKTLLDRIINEKLLTARAVYAFWPASSEGDDLVLYADDARRGELERFPMLRQQEMIPEKDPNLSLADFVAPRESGVPDYLGMFAVTAGIGADALARKFEEELDGDSANTVDALAGRLAEASAEYLHAQARRDWGYGEQEQLSLEDVMTKKFRGIRPAYGYPACPDQSERFKLLNLLEAAKHGITLTERAAMVPAASVSGLYFSHPQARYFDVGRLGRDRIQSYARRKGKRLEEVEKWLGGNLVYDPSATPIQTP